jgi:hypothetical protein
MGLPYRLRLVDLLAGGEAGEWLSGVS